MAQHRNYKVSMWVHPEFFKTFEKQRRKLQTQIGVSNLGQVAFTSMIKGFKMNVKKEKIPKLNTKKAAKTFRLRLL